MSTSTSASERPAPRRGRLAAALAGTLSAAVLLGGAALGTAALGTGAFGTDLGPRSGWTAAELAALRDLSLGSLPPPPPDPSNRFADDPAAAALGRALFRDARLSADGAVSCATCHEAERGFQDGRPLGRGVGRSSRRTMPLAGAAHLPWLFWDGRADSLWAQALGPLEDPAEHGGDRTRYARLVAAHHREGYEAAFGPLPDLSRLPAAAGPRGDAAARAAWAAMAEADREAVTGVFVNLGKAIAAYERGIAFGESRFDRYVEAVAAGREPAGDAALSEDEAAGLRLFIGKAACTNCHNGPLLTDGHFHNTGVAAAPGLPEDRGRLAGAREVRASPFSCLGPWSDARPADCAELRHMAEGPEYLRAYKPPSLRNAASRPPYMHAGQIATLAEVLDHYDRAPPAPAGHSELRPLGLSARERRQLEAFLGTLDGPVVDGAR
jgi:cytochrome c peroxidase